MTENLPGDQLTIEITSATRLAVNDLFRSHNEDFYFIAIAVTGDCNSPAISAWSFEALAREYAGRKDRLKSILSIKWSYADSPYFPVGEAHFDQVRQQLGARPNWMNLSDPEWDIEFEFRINAMEAALRRLDLEGLFGRGAIRDRLLINVEVIPPDHTNTLRAMRLNSSKALNEWLLEAAEPIGDMDVK